MYDQLQRVLLRNIEDVSLQPVDILPTEYQLCILHDVSLTVVRQALGLLEHEGMIVRTKGKGTYVAPRKTSETLAGRLSGLHEEVTARGGVVTSDVLRHEFVPAPAQVAHHLGLTAEGEVVARSEERRVGKEARSGG